MSSIMRSIPDPGSWDEEDVCCCWLAPSYFFLLLSFFLSPRFTSPLHFLVLPPIFVCVHFHSCLYFDDVTLSESALHSNKWTVCVCVYLRVRERLKVCVCVISIPLAALRNNCPERSLCLVMACCYLPPRCAEKKWLSNVVAFLDCSSWIQQRWMEPHLLHLTFQPISIFIIRTFFMAFLLYLGEQTERGERQCTLTL